MTELEFMQKYGKDLSIVLQNLQLKAMEFFPKTSKLSDLEFEALMTYFSKKLNKFDSSIVDLVIDTFINFEYPIDQDEVKELYNKIYTVTDKNFIENGTEHLFVVEAYKDLLNYITIYLANAK
jgi:hypothetical protein